jgi:hypothetical protein
MEGWLAMAAFSRLSSCSSAWTGHQTTFPIKGRHARPLPLGVTMTPEGVTLKHWVSVSQARHERHPATLPCATLAHC